jgi:hypothetical protein
MSWRILLTTQGGNENCWDRIVRNEIELNRIRQYILDNPLNWPKTPTIRHRTGRKLKLRVALAPEACHHTAEC